MMRLPKTLLFGWLSRPRHYGVGGIHTHMQGRLFLQVIFLCAIWCALNWSQQILMGAGLVSASHDA